MSSAFMVRVHCRPRPVITIRSARRTSLRAEILLALGLGLPAQGGLPGESPRPLAMTAEEIGAVRPHRSFEHSAASNEDATADTPPELAGLDPAPPEPVAGEHAQTWELVQRAQAGDGEAFGALYDLYVDVVFRFIFYRVHDRQLAEDFTSETFLRALRRIGVITYQGRDIGAWFMTIARNIVLDHVKSARARLEFTTGDLIEDDRSEPSTETAVLAMLSNEALVAAVNELGDEQRECVVLRFIQGLSVAETAEVMGKKEGAIKALQHRAIRKLAGSVANGDLT